MSPSVLIAEGGWQSFELGSAEWTVLILSALAALLAIAVGFSLVRSVLAADQGTPKMQEIAAAIQEGAWAYLKRQFRTIGVIVVPVAIANLDPGRRLGESLEDRALIDAVAAPRAGEAQGVHLA